MEIAATELTVFAVFMPDLQGDWTHPAWIAMALLCACAWVLIAVDLRRPRQPESACGKSATGAPAAQSGRTNLIF